MRHLKTQIYQEIQKFQSTHPVWGATVVLCGVGSEWLISIHAPRVGCDSNTYPSFRSLRNFNPRTPCGVRLLYLCYWAWFLLYFNPRTPCGVRPFPDGTMQYMFSISIHAPRVGCDFIFFTTRTVTIKFQSTHPVWGATHLCPIRH